MFSIRPGYFITPWRDCDRGYDRPSGRPRVSDPATYRSGTPRFQSHLNGLAPSIRETSGLARLPCIYGVVLSRKILKIQANLRFHLSSAQNREGGLSFGSWQGVLELLNKMIVWKAQVL